MKLEKIIDKIKKLSEYWHSSNCEDSETSGEDSEAKILIAQYILSKGYEVNIGNHKGSRLVQIFLNQEEGLNEEDYCGFEEEMLENFIHMFANPKNTVTGFINVYPGEGVYKPMTNVDEEIYMVINYYESKFWPEWIEFQYNLDDFGITD
jgi:hypothetical protein